MKYFLSCGRVTGRQAYILDDHDEERQLDAEGLVGVGWASDEVGRDVGSHDFKN